MAIGDVAAVTAGDCHDLYCFDAGLYGVDHYGAIYILDTDRPTIIETSTGRNHDALLAALDALGLAPDAIENIVLTHVHLDHAGGAGRLAAACPNADVYVHAVGAPFLTDPDPLVAGSKQVVGELWDYHVDPTPIPADRITRVTDRDTIDLGGRRLEALYVPGHATHQVALFDRDCEALFTGDAAGMWLPDHDLLTVTTPPTTFDFAQSLADLDTLADVAPRTLLYTHYGPRETGTAFRDYRQELTDWVAAVEAERERLDDDAVIEHFVSTSPLATALGDPAGTVPARMFVLGVLGDLDRSA